MNLVERTQAIILKPKEEWVKIKGESTPVAQLFMSYAAILALIPAVAQFIGYGLIGFKVPFLGFIRFPIGRALFLLVESYVSALLSVYIYGFVINALAPNFGSKQNLESAMKLAVYCLTPAWISGVFYIFPSLSWLVIIGALYGLYILYLGFASPMMETPPDKVMSYFVVSLVIVVAILIVFALIRSAIFFTGGGIYPGF